MHGETEISKAPRISWGIAHALLVLLAGLLYTQAGSQWWGGFWGIERAGDELRRLVLWLFGITLWLRMTFTGLYLLRRRFGWEEFWPVLFASAVYQLGFAALGTTNPKPVGTLAVLSIGLYLLGSFLNTYSELQRKRFKDRPENQGRLFVGGLFSRIRHVNYLGDSLWALGWAILTGSIWALIIPILLTTGFIFYFIPTLSIHLQSKYGEPYEQWVKRSWALIPFIY